MSVYPVWRRYVWVVAVRRKMNETFVRLIHLKVRIIVIVIGVYVDALSSSVF